MEEERRRPVRRKDISDEVIKSEYQSGMSVYRIHKAHGWDEMTITYRLKRMGIYEGRRDKK